MDREPEEPARGWRCGALFLIDLLLDLLTRLDNRPGALKLAERVTAKWPKYGYVLARAQFLATKSADAIRSQYLKHPGPLVQA